MVTFVLKRLNKRSSYLFSMLRFIIGGVSIVRNKWIVIILSIVCVSLALTSGILYKQKSDLNTSLSHIEKTYSDTFISTEQYLIDIPQGLHDFFTGVLEDQYIKIHEIQMLHRSFINLNDTLRRYLGGLDISHKSIDFFLENRSIETQKTGNTFFKMIGFYFAELLVKLGEEKGVTLSDIQKEIQLTDDEVTKFSEINHILHLLIDIFEPLDEREYFHSTVDQQFDQRFEVYKELIQILPELHSKAMKLHNN